MQRSQTLPDTFQRERYHGEEAAVGPPLEVGRDATTTTTTIADHHHQAQQQQQQTRRATQQQQQRDAIVRNIASFLTVSDAASLLSLDQWQHTERSSLSPSHHPPLPPQENNDETDIPRSDSWAIGVDMEGVATASPLHYSHVSSSSRSSWEQQLWIPQQPTPAYIAISPGATPRFDYEQTNNSSLEVGVATEDGILFGGDRDCGVVNNNDDDDKSMERILFERRRTWVQQRLAAAVYSHPGSVRSFCLQAYQSAKDILKERALQQPVDEEEDPETCIEPPLSKGGTQRQHPSIRPLAMQKRRSKRRKRLLSVITDAILHNVPLSVLMDVLEALGEVSFDTTWASFIVVGHGLEAVVRGLLDLLGKLWHGVSNFNPFQLLEAIVSFQFNAMGKTSEVLASGIHSVATGVGSASSLALHRLSAANLSVATRVTGGGTVCSSVRGELSGMRRSRSAPGTVINDKLLKKLSAMNDAARVVRYMESEDETGGLTKQARSKVQRMMHYEVSLRPFVATVQGPHHTRHSPNVSPLHPPSLGTGPPRQDLSDSFSGAGSPYTEYIGDRSDAGSQSSSENPSISPLLYTPQSFPPTPHSRQIVIARGGRFADDVVFLARDRLRLHDSLESENERTREMAKLLREGKRLAVFNAQDAANGIELTCGQHIATKVGNMLYCTTRSMVPVLRNCLVYFEMTVLPRSFGNMALQPSMTTLSIGLSTEEMPSNVLVGAWQGSCGLCTTGQIFSGGEWCAPSDPTVAAYRDGATIGCLVYLDDASAVDTWEGILVNATITFNVNGFLVAPVVSSSIGVAAAAASTRRSPGVGMPLEAEALPAATLPPLTTTAPPTSAPPNQVFNADPASSTATPTSLTPAWTVHRPSVTLSIKVPSHEELYPTCSLHSPATSVMCRFSAEDIVASSRETIGAPIGATVYAVDGSVIFM